MPNSQGALFLSGHIQVCGSSSPASWCVATLDVPVQTFPEGKSEFPGSEIPGKNLLQQNILVVLIICRFYHMYSTLIRLSGPGHGGCSKEDQRCRRQSASRFIPVPIEPTPGWSSRTVCLWNSWWGGAGPKREGAPRNVLQTATLVQI